MAFTIFRMIFQSSGMAFMIFGMAFQNNDSKGLKKMKT
jgi:hypothetical protein